MSPTAISSLNEQPEIRFKIPNFISQGSTIKDSNRKNIHLQSRNQLSDKHLLLTREDKDVFQKPLESKIVVLEEEE